MPFQQSLLYFCCLLQLSSHPEVGSDNHPDFYHFKVSAVEELLKAYGKNSQQFKDAVKLLQKTITEVRNFC